MPIAPRWVSTLFFAAALVNWATALVAVVQPAAAMEWLGVEAPGPTTALRIWAGTAFMFGFLFWEIARRPIENTVLAKYAWIQKSVVVLAVVFGLAQGDAPWALAGAVALTDAIWIPPFVYADYLLRNPD